MSGYIHGKAKPLTVPVPVDELRRLKANQRAAPVRPKTAALIAHDLAQAPGRTPPKPSAPPARTWDKARMQDEQIKRCGVCGDWTWRGKCKVPHEVLARGEAA